VADLINPVLVELDPAECVEAQYRETTNKLYCWRAMRQVSKHHLKSISNFGKSTEGGALDLVAKDLESELKKDVPKDS